MDCKLGGGGLFFTPRQGGFWHKNSGTVPLKSECFKVITKVNQNPASEFRPNASLNIKIVTSKMLTKIQFQNLTQTSVIIGTYHHYHQPSSGIGQPHQLESPSRVQTTAVTV